MVAFGQENYWHLFYSNPRAASLWLSQRSETFGSGRFHFVHHYVPSHKFLTRIELDIHKRQHMMFLVPAVIATALQTEFAGIIQRNDGDDDNIQNDVHHYGNHTISNIKRLRRNRRKSSSSLQSWMSVLLHDPRTIPIVVTDELCERIIDYKKWPSPALRQYWDNKELVEPSSRGFEPQYLPLGPRYEFAPVNQNDVRPPEERQYFFNMVTSISTNIDVRLPLHQLVLEVATKDKDQTITEKRKVSKMLPRIGASFIHNTKLWRGELPLAEASITISAKQKKKGKRVAKGYSYSRVGNSNEVHDEALSAKNFKQVLLDSVFTLSPSGHNPETFRLYEAAEAGSIPIVDYTDVGNLEAQAPDIYWPRHRGGDTVFLGRAGGMNQSSSSSSLPSRCSSPWQPFIDSGAPFIWIEDWADIEAVLAALRAEGSVKLRNRQHQLEQWYKSYMASGVATVEKAITDRNANFAKNFEPFQKGSVSEEMAEFDRFVGDKEYWAAWKAFEEDLEKYDVRKREKIKTEDFTVSDTSIETQSDPEANSTPHFVATTRVSSLPGVHTNSISDPWKRKKQERQYHRPDGVGHADPWRNKKAALKEKRMKERAQKIASLL